MRAKEIRKYVLIMASYACERHHVESPSPYLGIFITAAAITLGIM